MPHPKMDTHSAPFLCSASEPENTFATFPHTSDNAQLKLRKFKILSKRQSVHLSFNHSHAELDFLPQTDIIQRKGLFFELSKRCRTVFRRPHRAANNVDLTMDYPWAPGLSAPDPLTHRTLNILTLSQGPTAQTPCYNTGEWAGCETSVFRRAGHHCSLYLVDPIVRTNWIPQRGTRTRLSRPVSQRPRPTAKFGFHIARMRRLAHHTTQPHVKLTQRSVDAAPTRTPHIRIQ